MSCMTVVHDFLASSRALCCLASVKKHKKKHLTNSNTSLPLHQCFNTMTLVNQSHFKLMQVKRAAVSSALLQPKSVGCLQL